MSDRRLTATSSLLIAATHSGAGKTTVTSIVLRGLRHRGLSVQPFKIGPDFIDAAYHADICDRPSINLDLWMMGESGVQRSYEHWSGPADISVIEAMGGLYDNSGGGSAADIAKLLDVPVLLVLDAWGMTRTAVPILEGLMAFDPDVRIAGCILNRVGSRTHGDMIYGAFPPHLRRLIVGFIPRRTELEIAERHLGLTAVQELTDGAHEEAQITAVKYLDVDELIRVADWGSERRKPETSAPKAPQTSRTTNGAVRVAIARDQAFHFYYEENLALLREAGCELVEYKPTGDPHLPPDIDAVYIGGGYPESFASQLEANETLRFDLAEKAAAGLPVYAECGGYIYLGRSLTGFDGVKHRMSGVLPIDFVMDSDHLTIDYVSLETRRESPLGPPGTMLRGQEFHQSRIVAAGSDPDLFDVTTSDGRTCAAGHQNVNAAGSYVHLHFASNPQVVFNIKRSARAHRTPAGR